MTSKLGLRCLNKPVYPNTCTNDFYGKNRTNKSTKKKTKKKQVPTSGGNEVFVGKKVYMVQKTLKYINASTLENISSTDSDQLGHPMDAI